MSSTGGSSELTWTCRSFHDLLYRCWENEYFLYHPDTGQTHVLNQFSWDILSRCAEKPCSNSCLSKLVSEGVSVEQQDGLLEALDIHLDHLAQLGFLETVESHALH